MSHRVRLRLARRRKGPGRARAGRVGLVLAAVTVAAGLGLGLGLRTGPGPSSRPRVDGPGRSAARSPPPVSDSAPVVPTLSPSAASAALAQLDTLSVGPRASKEGYHRDAFGQRWADVDHNGCDTRNDVLRRDLLDLETKPGTRGCVVLSGRLLDPYTGAELPFDKARAPDIQIDHVVSLSNAWQTGAQNLSPDVRRSLANDPLNLLAVDGPTNEAKGDADASEWLTPNLAFRCELVARQIGVKAKYGLWVTPPERAAMAEVLGPCVTR